MSSEHPGSRFAGRLTLLERVMHLRRTQPEPEGIRAEAPSEDEDRLGAVERRLERLENELEGLQDAVHREVVRQNARIDELLKRTEPGEMARALSDDARRRGL
jgi:hypothetical protein